MKKINFRLKKESLKESAKLLLDFSKVIFAITVVTPFVKGGSLDIISIITSVILAGIGIYVYNKGAKDE